MGHHLYDENKQLKLEIAGLRQQLRERRGLDDDAAIDVLAREAFKQILTGKAALVTTIDSEGAHITYFQMLPVPAPEQP